jgi:hypothetical protein
MEHIKFDMVTLREEKAIFSLMASFQWETQKAVRQVEFQSHAHFPDRQALLLRQRKFQWQSAR